MFLFGYAEMSTRPKQKAQHTATPHSFDCRLRAKAHRLRLYVICWITRRAFLAIRPGGRVIELHARNIGPTQAGIRT